MPVQILAQFSLLTPEIFWSALDKYDNLAKYLDYGSSLHPPLLLIPDGFFLYKKRLKVVSTIFYQKFFFSSNDRPSKTMKNVFHFI